MSNGFFIEKKTKAAQQEWWSARLPKFKKLARRNDYYLEGEFFALRACFGLLKNNE